jgi:hypothetical protein
MISVQRERHWKIDSDSDSELGDPTYRNPFSDIGRAEAGFSGIGEPGPGIPGLGFSESEF